jgi:hypothetical protein
MGRKGEQSTPNVVPVDSSTHGMASCKQRKSLALKSPHRKPLSCTHSSVMFGRVYIEVGRLPVSKLSCSRKYWMAERLPRLVGMLPSNSLPSAYNITRLVRLPRSSGRLPFSPKPLTLKAMTVELLPSQTTPDQSLPHGSSPFQLPVKHEGSSTSDALKASSASTSCCCGAPAASFTPLNNQPYNHHTITAPPRLRMEPQSLP